METSGPSNSPALQNYYERREQSVATQAEPIRQALQQAGVATVLAEYDGCGDSGQFEQVVFEDAAGAAVGVDDGLREQVTSLLYDLIELRHSGWENNDGAFGEFRWSLADNGLHHEHNERYTETEYSEYEGFSSEGDGPSTTEGAS